MEKLIALAGRIESIAAVTDILSAGVPHGVAILKACKFLPNIVCEL